MHLPALISDLALILIVAGITTIIFKKIRQPLVLGYMVAGFLTGPFFSVFPTVVDTESIHIWSEIGIICLMFALGLEFSFHKLANVGGTAIITSMTEVAGLFLCGFVTGNLLGWNLIDSILLGSILAMSSSTIIIKAFDELGMRGKKFTEIVFGALIVEGVVGIFLMVGMSTFVLSKGAGGMQIVSTVAQLLFYLVLWLILGIYVIPSALQKAKNLMSDETLLIVSLGVCFGVVLLFSFVGFSTASGAFIAGSILAGTMFSEKIEGLVKPITDLFGAVFFISVGMLVDPAVLVQYAIPILVITIATLFGKVVFSSIGVLLSGQTLRTAIYCGSSLAQIGELAFIIAALGMSLNLSSDFLYPVVVSVSVITTFTTPFFIKHADVTYLFVKKLMPAKLYSIIESHTSESQSEREHTGYWNQFLKKYFTNMVVSVVMAFGVFELGKNFISPALESFLPTMGGKILATVVVLLLMSPFLATLLRQKDKNFMILLVQSKANLFPLFVFVVVRVTVTIILVVIAVNSILSIPIIWLILPAVAFVAVISHSDWVIGKYFQIEARFLANLNEKVLFEQEAESGEDQEHHHWLSEELWIAEYHIEADCEDAGRHLKDLKWKKRFNVNIVKITSGKRHHYIIPGGNHKLHPGDSLLLIGTKMQIEAFTHDTEKRPGITRQGTLQTLRDFIVNQTDEHQLFCYAITVNKDLYFGGKNLKDSKIRAEWHCDVVGVKHSGYPIICPDVNYVINNSDQLWLLGGQAMVQRLVIEGLIQSEEFAM